MLLTINDECVEHVQLGIKIGFFNRFFNCYYSEGVEPISPTHHAVVSHAFQFPYLIQRHPYLISTDLLSRNVCSVQAIV